MRAKLENLLNIFLPRNLEIHHIDCNRNNNSLDNLILLRSFIHWDCKKCNHDIMKCPKLGKPSKKLIKWAKGMVRGER